MSLLVILFLNKGNTIVRSAAFCRAENIIFEINCDQPDTEFFFLRSYVRKRKTEI